MWASVLQSHRHRGCSEDLILPRNLSGYLDKSNQTKEVTDYR